LKQFILEQKNFISNTFRELFIRIKFYICFDPSKDCTGAIPMKEPEWASPSAKKLLKNTMEPLRSAIINKKAQYSSSHSPKSNLSFTSKNNFPFWAMLKWTSPVLAPLS